MHAEIHPLPPDPRECGPGDPPGQTPNLPLGVGLETPSPDPPNIPPGCGPGDPPPDPPTSPLGVGLETPLGTECKNITFANFVCGR